MPCGCANTHTRSPQSGRKAIGRAFRHLEISPVQRERPPPRSCQLLPLRPRVARCPHFFSGKTKHLSFSWHFLIVVFATNSIVFNNSLVVSAFAVQSTNTPRMPATRQDSPEPWECSTHQGLKEGTGPLILPVGRGCFGADGTVQHALSCPRA